MGELRTKLIKRSIAPSRLDNDLLNDSSALIRSQGLQFESDFDDLVCVLDDDRLVACGARSGYVLKMLTITPSHQGNDILSELVSTLILSANTEGHDTVFVFTAPQNVASFQALNFRLLVTHSQAAMLEHGPGIDAYLRSHVTKCSSGHNGAIVMNGNPFTLGHQHLVEYAAQHVDHLYLFVVREDKSDFAFTTRFKMAQMATAHINNISVLDTSRYAVSSGTFPSYFLKQFSVVAKNQMHIDVSLFAKYIAPFFNITCRFVGQEPLCKTTAAYNEVLAEVCNLYGLKLIEIPRIIANNMPISATLVRKAFAINDVKTLRSLVPLTTLDILQSLSVHDCRTVSNKRREEV